jgi:hypothetical protein
MNKLEARERLKKEIITRTQNGEVLMPLIFVGENLQGIPPYECLTVGDILSVFNEIEREGLIECSKPLVVQKNKHYVISIHQWSDFN